MARKVFKKKVKPRVVKRKQYKKRSFVKKTSYKKPEQWFRPGHGRVQKYVRNGPHYTITGNYLSKPAKYLASGRRPSLIPVVSPTGTVEMYISDGLTESPTGSMDMTTGLRPYRRRYSPAGVSASRWNPANEMQVGMSNSNYSLRDRGRQRLHY